MKRIFLMLAIIATMTTLACKKDKSGDEPVTGPRTDVPVALQGNWMYGNFSMTEYWNQYPGDYLGNAFQYAFAFRFMANGTYEQYFTSSVVSGGVTTYQQSVTKGTVVIDELNQTLTTYPGRSHYKSTRNRQTVEDRDLASGELSGPTKYVYNRNTEANGSQALYLLLQGTNSPLVFLKK